MFSKHPDAGKQATKARGGAVASTNGRALGEKKIPVEGLRGKEGSKGMPSWVRGERPYVIENGKQFAERVLTEKYGAGNFKKGAGSEYSIIQKWVDRSFKNP